MHVLRVCSLLLCLWCSTHISAANIGTFISRYGFETTFSSAIASVLMMRVARVAGHISPDAEYYLWLANLGFVVTGVVVTTCAQQRNNSRGLDNNVSLTAEWTEEEATYLV